LPSVGWKIILLIRISPLFPDSILNYLLAATSVPYFTYAVSSSIATLPWCGGFAYFGSMYSDVKSALNGEVEWNPWVFTVVTAVSLLLLIVIGVYLGKTARRMLSDVLDGKTKLTK